MLRDFFPCTATGAALYNGYLQDETLFFKIFPAEDSLDKMLIPVNAFLVENGYESILIEQLNNEVYTYENGPVSLSPHGYLEQFVLHITKEPIAKSQTQFLISELVKFRNERDWEQFHNPKDLALAMSIEASELLETFLWKNHNDANIEKVKEELADVFAYAFLIAEKYNLDVEEIVLNKIKKNAEKYPVHKAKGSAKKYNEL